MLRLKVYGHHLLASNSFKMKERKGADSEEIGGGEKLRGKEGVEIVIIIYFMGKNVFSNKKGEKRK